MLTGYKREWLFIGKARIIIYEFSNEYSVHASLKDRTVIRRNEDKKEAIIAAIQGLFKERNF